MPTLPTLHLSFIQTPNHELRSYSSALEKVRGAVFSCAAVFLSQPLSLPYGHNTNSERGREEGHYDISSLHACYQVLKLCVRKRCCYPNPADNISIHHIQYIPQSFKEPYPVYPIEISSLNLLRVISEQEGCPIEELNAGRICDWFVKDKLRREQNLDSAVLQWDESNFQL